MVAACAVWCIVKGLQDEAAPRPKKRPNARSRRRYDKARLKSRLSDEEFARAAALHPTERRLLELRAIAPPAPATTMEQPGQEPVPLDPAHGPVRSDSAHGIGLVGFLHCWSFDAETATLIAQSLGTYCTVGHLPEQTYCMTQKLPSPNVFVVVISISPSSSL